MYPGTVVMPYRSQVTPMAYTNWLDWMTGRFLFKTYIHV